MDNYFDIDEEIEKSRKQIKELEEELASMKIKEKEFKTKLEKAQKKLLEKIRREIVAYNRTKPENLLALVELTKESMLQYKVEVAEERKKRDVKDMFICLYDEEQMDLFERETVRLNLDQLYTEAELYFSREKRKRGAYAKRYDIDGGERWLPSGTIVSERDGMIFPINCTMYEAARFDSVRYKMKKEGILDYYTVGLASDEEIEEVLTYAREQRQLDTRTLEENRKLNFLVSDFEDLYVCLYEENKVGLFQNGEVWSKISFNEAEPSLCIEKSEDIKILKALPYKDMRASMVREGLLKVTNEEVFSIKQIDQVLTYAVAYFRIEKPKEKVKK